jgi:hypothetical protein
LAIIDQTKTPNRFELQIIPPQSATHKTKNLNFQPLQTSTQYHQNPKLHNQILIPSAINREEEFRLWDTFLESGDDGVGE